MQKAFALYTTLALAATYSNLTVQAEPHFAVIHLGNLGNEPSESRGVNDAGEIVGGSRNLAVDRHAFRWVKGVMEDLNPDIRSAQAFGINELGQVVGFAGFDGSRFVGRAFLWEGGEMLDLGTLGGEHSEAAAINDAGQVVGWANFEIESGRSRGFLWQDGVMTQLGPSCEVCTGAADDINNAGQVVGVASTPISVGTP